VKKLLKDTSSEAVVYQGGKIMEDEMGRECDAHMGNEKSIQNICTKT
jgi:hypothetical protein